MENRMSDMLTRYMTVDDRGASITIFMPTDCNKNCEFCINKKEYRQKCDFSIDKIIETFSKIDNVFPNCNVVITGGEPLNNLNDLRDILIAAGKKREVYINTGFDYSEEEYQNIILFFEVYGDYVTGLNISEHMSDLTNPFNAARIADKMYALDQIKVPYRINCVLAKTPSYQKMLNYLNYFYVVKRCAIQFREDYMNINLSDVQNEYYNSENLEELNRCLPLYEVIKEPIRKSFIFNLGGPSIKYHVTAPYSTFKYAKEGVVWNVLTDIIIKQNGEIHSDWDGTPLNLTGYLDKEVPVYVEK